MLVLNTKKAELAKLKCQLNSSGDRRSRTEQGLATRASRSYAHVAVPDSEQFDEREENSLSQRTSAKRAETDTLSFDDEMDHSSIKRTRDDDHGADSSEDEQRHEVIMTSHWHDEFRAPAEDPTNQVNNKIER